MLAPDDQRFELDELRYSLASDIVELVILTGDEGFLQTLREAVGGTRRLWHVPSADKVSDLLVAGQVGILVLDESALLQSASSFVSEIKRQFPDLVIVVAGNRDAEGALAALISSGVVYRFIHKPMSPGRAKLFADAAVKKYGDQRRRAITALAPEPARRSPMATAAVILTVICGALAGAWMLWRHSHQGSALVEDGLMAPFAAPQSPQLARASAALAANRLTSPAGDNALELYQQALRRDPQDAEARAGLNEVYERLLARAENALLEERLNEAASAIDVARKAGVEGDRIAFLATQLAQARDRQKAAPVRVAADGRGNDPAASAGDATSAGDAAPVVKAGAVAGDTAALQEQRSGEPVAQLLRLAAERRTGQQWLTPEHDSARYYLLEAARLEPNSDAVAQAKEALALAMLSAAHNAIDRRDFARADDLLTGADGIAAAANIEAARQLLQTARVQADAAAHDQLAKSAAERLQQDRLIEPTNDNAKYYILTLRGVDPGNAALVGLIQDLGARLVAKGRRALALEQYDAARSWLDEVGSIGFASNDSAQLARDLEAALARRNIPDAVVGAGELTLVTSVPPTYPSAAERGHAEGWVDLEFTVAENGAVRDISVREASPPGVFDYAAISALSQWTYRPVMRDGQPVTQRAHVRMRFTAPR